ncbi:MAG: MotA/TolQ/ExbB proton channel family protein [Planctomycetia bacterium]|nr:MotA/TolQ/ExbB proton channel family protein [Planctomycetia bacterium]
MYRFTWWIIISVFFFVLGSVENTFSQQNQENTSGNAAAVVSEKASSLADKELAEMNFSEEKENALPNNVPDKNLSENAKKEKEHLLTILDLIQKGGFLMWPIGVMSLLVVAFGLERFVALRAYFVAPRRLFNKVDALSREKADPREIYNVCCQHPSSSANIIKSALMKVGRPVMEIQSVIQEAKDNEAEKLFGNVRILVLAATITPLIGLLGTVIGMIEAFMVTAQLNAATTIGVNRAEQLSQGIYIALVTTCAGLSVAIPAAILAHWYEGRIVKLFHIIDRKLLRFSVYLTEVEGRVHVTPEQYTAYYEAAKSVKRGKKSSADKEQEKVPSAESDAVSSRKGKKR